MSEDAVCCHTSSVYYDRVLPVMSNVSWGSTFRKPALLSSSAKESTYFCGPRRLICCQSPSEVSTRVDAFCEWRWKESWLPKRRQMMDRVIKRLRHWVVPPSGPCRVEGIVGFPQRKQLPRSTANCAVSNCSDARFEVLMAMLLKIQIFSAMLHGVTDVSKDCRTSIFRVKRCKVNALFFLHGFEDWLFHQE